MKKSLIKQGLEIETELIKGRLYRVKNKGKTELVLRDIIPHDLKGSIAPTVSDGYGYYVLKDKLEPLATHKSMQPGNETLKHINFQSVKSKIIVMHSVKHWCHANLTLENILIGYVNGGFKVYFIGWEHAFRIKNPTWKDEVYLRAKYSFEDFYKYKSIYEEFIFKDYDCIDEVPPKTASYPDHYRLRTRVEDYHMDETKAFALICKSHYAEQDIPVYNYKIKVGKQHHYVSRIPGLGLADNTGVYMEEESMYKMLRTIYKSVEEKLIFVNLRGDNSLGDLEDLFNDFIDNVGDRVKTNTKSLVTEMVNESNVHEILALSDDDVVKRLKILYEPVKGVRIDSLTCDKRLLLKILDIEDVTGLQPHTIGYIMLNSYSPDVVWCILSVVTKYPKLRREDLPLIKFCIDHGLDHFVDILAYTIQLPIGSKEEVWLEELFNEDTLVDMMNGLYYAKPEIYEAYSIFFLRLFKGELFDVLIKHTDEKGLKISYNKEFADRVKDHEPKIKTALSSGLQPYLHADTLTLSYKPY